MKPFTQKKKPLNRHSEGTTGIALTADKDRGENEGDDDSAIHSCGEYAG